MATNSNVPAPGAAQTAPSFVQLTDSAGASVAVSATGAAIPTDAVAVGYTDGTNLRIPASDPAGIAKVGSMPLGTAVYAGQSGAAQINTATVAAVAAKTNYLDGFDIDGNGATAGSVIAVVVSGLLGGSLTFSIGIPTGVAVPVTISKRFNPPLQASAANISIAVTVPSFGAGNTGSSVAAFGHFI